MVLKTRRYGLFSGRVDSDGTDHFREKEPRRVTEHSHVKSRRGIYILGYEITSRLYLAIPVSAVVF